MWLFCRDDADVYSQAASNLVSGNNLEQTIQQILDMGGGTWERGTVVRALRAAYNNPERAIDYLYSVSFMLTNCFTNVLQLHPASDVFNCSFHFLKNLLNTSSGILLFGKG
jgi:hypothetical protein